MTRLCIEAVHVTLDLCSVPNELVARDIVWNFHRITGQ
jgi:hypothetical protein